MMDDRRLIDPAEGAYALAIMFTVGYFAFLWMLMVYPIPDQNKELMLTLAGILSAAMLGIVKYFYDGSKSADKVQSANIARSVKSEAVVQDIAKATATGTLPPAPTAPIVADQVNVETQSTVVTEKEPKS